MLASSDTEYSSRKYQNYSGDKTWESVVDMMKDLTSLNISGNGTHGGSYAEEISGLKLIRREISEGLPSASDYLIKSASKIVDDVDKNTIGPIRSDRAALEKRIEHTEASIRSLEKEREENEVSLLDLKGLCDKTREAIEEHKKFTQETTEGMDIIDEVAAARIAEVPRVRSQLAMYASVTGIRWDFEGDEIAKQRRSGRRKKQLLQGIVTLPFKREVHKFCIDPSQSSAYEIANQLWSVMENGVDSTHV
uniref:Kinetochore protein Spc24 n=1 Tax=Corethron hystrix TaxID=216773 RepID=A0A7S1FT99_9STRA|mmetsp:Transcript_27248/g.62537  ORF Transcript_27248/g.62537 Transcript_27248/m.62537 type:complete len:250 (+) Transcript_27248:219-968(+)